MRTVFVLERGKTVYPVECLIRKNGVGRESTRKSNCSFSPAIWQAPCLVSKKKRTCHIHKETLQKKHPAHTRNLMGPCASLASSISFCWLKDMEPPNRVASAWKAAEFVMKFMLNAQNITWKKYIKPRFLYISLCWRLVLPFPHVA